jgi:hypothetical protein
MTTLRSVVFVSASFLVLLSSCNIYTPFASPGSDTEYLEEARKCLASSDYDCAITQYNRLSDTTVKNQKLCLVNISKAGMNLTSLVNVLTSSSSGSSLLKLVANQILLRGYTSTRLDAAAAAVTACSALGTDQTSTLLKMISYVTDCGVRMAKSDTLIATSEGGSASCNSATTGNRSGAMDDSDIGGDAGGALSVGNPGMCEADAQACITDINAAAAVSGSLGSSSGLSALSSNISAASTLIGTGSGTAFAQAARVGLKNNI